MRWDRRLWRYARRIEAAYSGQESFGGDVGMPERAWQDARNALKNLAAAERLGWRSAAEKTRQAAEQELERLAGRLRDLAGALRMSARRLRPSTQALYEELLAVEDEFGAVGLDNQLVRVTTEPIVFDEVRLGRFEIQLDLRRLEKDPAYFVRALDPNPAGHSDSTTHPHVDSDKLCSGEGRQPIAAALAEGRIGDFFTIVNRVLHTYAPGSAYVELDRWHGVPCYACDATIAEDDSLSCPGCVETFCSDCLVTCNACCTGYCADCIDRCRSCDESYCRECLKTCDRCRRETCESCLENDLCPSCLEETENETEEEAEVSSDESPPSETDTQV